ncbi:AEL107Wp [Eremothecium gossypii ATCC 10895]|uniref:Vacuolar protein sorting-associated protein 35 n=1 Tax=Eremothecium gossypii (strain ATCC 10895 / CBS 109.51 / FGSC 9923 / NRRL Y-1056) TaxID=284811 RepID=Q757W9_EREGS|nr:AEL107Wp [Eremothecium gossypii ATCC 10895]AAS52578.1 AEL107Wp [Eremothecium gossypii ATCC 10895]AEY96880.1 FAEL107Wp [Eremothecium gossypii FDAG1]
MSYAESVEQATGVIKQQTVLIQRHLAQRKLLDALKHISIMLTELRNPSLTPKQYYELYILVYDALSVLSQYLVENHPKRHHLADLYELVQYAGNILPRLYLMITVGTAFLQIKDSPREEILKDMIEMCKGVQNPVRGLFLRYYLSQRTKEWLLPQNGPAGNASEGRSQENVENNVKKFNVEFIINNFIEMNKLWVRLQHYGPLRERELRTKERRELQILIGSNLVRLSQIVEDDSKLYAEVILPQLLDQIVQCRDVVSQEYLLDVICQVFPDEFHLATLPTLLETTLKFNPDVSINKVVSNLVERFNGYVERQSGDIDSVQNTFRKLCIQGQPTSASGDTISSSGGLFFVFWRYLEKLSEQRPDLPLNDLFPLVQGILKLSLTWYPDVLSNVDCLFKFTVRKCQENGGPDANPDYEYLFQDLLLSMTSSSMFYRVLTECESYQKLLSMQPVGLQKLVVNCILDTIFKAGITITNRIHLEKILLLCESLIKVNNPKIHNSGEDAEQHSAQDDDPTSCLLNIEQEKLAQVVHICRSQSIEKQVELLLTCKSWFYKGGIQMRYTYPAVVTAFWKLIRKTDIKKSKYPSREKKYRQLIKQLFKYVSRCLSELGNTVGAPCADLVFKMNLQSAAIADHLGLSEISYDFFTQVFTIFEESLSDSRSQFQAIITMAQTLQKTRSLYVENYYDSLITRCTLYGSRLLKKQDQCRAVYLCSHLWWATEIPLIGEEEGITDTFYREGKRVLECLQRSLRVADSIMDNVQSCQLMVEILNRCCYYFVHGDESATHVGPKYINGLIELIETNLKSLKIEESVEFAESKLPKPSYANFVVGVDGSYIQVPTSPTATVAAVMSKPPNITISSLVPIVTGYLQRTLNYIEDQKVVDDRFRAIIV